MQRVHRALQHDDTLREICEHIALGHSLRSPGKQTLARTARVCKAFSDPALSVLWRKLDTFLCLLKTLPSSILRLPGPNHEAEDTYVLQGETSSMEWARFQYYARHIHDLEIPVDPHYFHPSIFHELLYLARGVTLFPCLRRLCYNQLVDSAYGLNLLVFVSPSLCDLTIDLKGMNAEEPDFTDYTVGRFLHLLVPVAQGLEKVIVRGVVPVSCFRRIASFKALRHVQLSAKASIRVSELVEYYRDLENLEKLVVELSTDADHRQDAKLQGFRHLQQLKVRCRSTGRVNHLLMAISSEHLESLTLWGLQGGRRYSWSQFRDFFDPIGTKFSNSLKELSLSITARSRETTAFRLMEGISPLLRLRHLSQFRLYVTTKSFLWMQDDVRDIGSSWPGIRILDLAFSCHGTEPSVYGLVDFARHCPNLTQLQLSPCNMDVDPPQELDSYPVLSHPLEELKLWPSSSPLIIRNPLQVARFLDRLFPRLSTTSVINTSESWANVLSSISALQSARREEKGRILVEPASTTDWLRHHNQLEL